MSPEEVISTVVIVVALLWAALIVAFPAQGDPEGTEDTGPSSRGQSR